MTTSQRHSHDAPPTRPDRGGYGWRGTADRPRHAGVGRRVDVERTADATADWTADDQGYCQSALPIGSAESADRQWASDADRHDGSADGELPVRRHYVLADEDGDADGGADLVPIDSADGDAVEPRPFLLAGGARHLLGLRFVDDDLLSLKKLLKLARKGRHGMAHNAVVRGAHEAFFWGITAPFYTIAILLMWLLATNLIRTIVFFVVAPVAAVPLNTIPVVEWLVPDWLPVDAWPILAWQVIGGIALVFVLAAVVCARRARP